MRRVSDWRSQDTASEFEYHDRADLAQEFLCRNSVYARDHFDTQTYIAAGRCDMQNELEGLARRWGLCFPLLPGRFTDRSTRALVARPRTKRGHHRRDHR